MKRQPGSDSNPDSNDFVEAPPLDMHRPELSRQHVRALNTKFARYIKMHGKIKALVSFPSNVNRVSARAQENLPILVRNDANSGNDGGENKGVVARTFLIRTKTEEDRNKLASANQEYVPAT